RGVDDVVEALGDPQAGQDGTGRAGRSFAGFGAGGTVSSIQRPVSSYQEIRGFPSRAGVISLISLEFRFFPPFA
ncbi:MAG: hypothetical protein AABZ64_09670, partial [Nitrospinota bacterium]